MKEKINVFIIGDTENEHTTYVENNKRYFKFYTDGYEGNRSTEIIHFLEFLGYEVFEIYKNNFNISNEYIVNDSSYY